MQAFANVATKPAQRTTKTGGRTYWEFRAAESAKNEAKAGATWYTVRVFQDEDPGFAKGDFIRLIGKLKFDVFMSREGKPMGVLVVMCYEARKYEKGRAARPASVTNAAEPSALPASDDASGSKSGAESRAEAPAGQTASQPATQVPVEQLEDEFDEGWLALVR